MAMRKPNAVSRGCPSCAEALGVIETLDPHFAGLLRSFIGDLTEANPTDDRLRELCAITTVAGLDEAQELADHLRHGLETGLDPRQMLEATLATFLFVGLPTMCRAVAVFREVIPALTGAGEAPEDYPGHGTVDGYDAAALVVGTEMYGPRRARMNINNFRAWDRRLGDAVERLAYAGINRRRVLPPVDREICTVALLAALGRVAPMEWHTKAALRLGATPAQLRWAAIGQLPHVGFPVIIQALRALDPVISDWLAHPSTDDLE
jgi:4-carboxymuconolactone decarboxylase